MTFQVADAEAVPFPGASFDVVFSTFGVMFAPDHEQAARELMRVRRPGGESRSRRPVGRPARSVLSSLRHVLATSSLRRRTNGRLHPGRTAQAG